MKLVALSQLAGVYGTVRDNEEFECPDDIATQLLAMNKVRKAAAPKIIKETKVITPPEVGPCIPFRDGAVPDAQSKGMATSGDSVLQKSDLAEQGTPGPRGRRGRFRLDKR
jgi:hypothetical protein